MKFLNLSILIVILLGSGFSVAQQVRAVNDYWPPFSDDSLQGNGLGVELLRLAMTPLGHAVSFEHLPWTRLLKMAEVGEDMVIAGLWFNQDRTRFLLYSEPYYQSKIKFLKRADDTFTYAGIKSLDGKAVGIIANYQYGDDFYQTDSFKRYPAKDIQLNIDRLLKRRIDLTLDTAGVLMAAVRNFTPEQQKQLALVDAPLREAPVYIACPKVNKNCADIIRHFNRALERFRQDGTYHRLLQQYGLE